MEAAQVKRHVQTEMGGVRGTALSHAHGEEGIGLHGMDASTEGRSASQADGSLSEPGLCNHDIDEHGKSLSRPFECLCERRTHLGFLANQETLASESLGHRFVVREGQLGRHGGFQEANLICRERGRGREEESQHRERGGTSKERVSAESMAAAPLSYRAAPLVRLFSVVHTSVHLAPTRIIPYRKKILITGKK